MIAVKTFPSTASFFVEQSLVRTVCLTDVAVAGDVADDVHAVVDVQLCVCVEADSTSFVFSFHDRLTVRGRPSFLVARILVLAARSSLVHLLCHQLPHLRLQRVAGLLSK